MKFCTQKQTTTQGFKTKREPEDTIFSAPPQIMIVNLMVKCKTLIRPYIIV